MKDMKAMVLTKYGEDAEFQLTEIAKPTLKSGHVLVRVAATSVNTVDTMIRQLGQENLPLAPDLPAVLGMDFAGTIEEIGEGVTDFVVGDEVYGCAGGLIGLRGALAEFMLADAYLIAKKPKSLSMREAAALPLVGITAYEGVQRAAVGGGKKVLVHGGAGGVGHVAVQLASYLGADVYATGSGEKQLEVIRKYNATAIDYKKEMVAEYVAHYTDGAGFDIIFDSVGGENLANSFEAAALNGTITTTLSMLELDLTPAHLKGLSLHIIFMLIPMLHNYKRADHGAILAKLSEIVDAGAVQPLLDEKKFGLMEVGQAYDHLAGGHAMGKVVVQI